MSWWAASMDGVELTRGGWSFLIPGYDARFSEELRESLIDSAFAAIDGTLATRVRRSRHAETWFDHFDQVGGLDAYFKVLDPIRGLNRARKVFKRRRAVHVASISEHLRADGIGVAEILLLGAEHRGGREIIVTARVEGFNLVRHLKRAQLASRRIVLRALGAEIARLHRAGYIHGDLTPYNIFVAGLEPPKFVFIDHDRTRRTILSRFERPRMRNLVQLGHLDVGGRGGRVARGVVVHQDDGRRRKLDRPAHHLARIDRRVVDGALVHHLVGDQLVLFVEKEHAKLFTRRAGHGDPGVGQKCAP